MMRAFPNGSPAHVEYIGFTGISAFNRVVLNINYTASSGHTQDIDIFNYTSNTWDTLGRYRGSGNWQQFALGVIDDAPYINTTTGNVTIRNYQCQCLVILHIELGLIMLLLNNLLLEDKAARSPTGQHRSYRHRVLWIQMLTTKPILPTALAQAAFDSANVINGVDITQNTKYNCYSRY
jgi:hypothetical protein